ncbi:MAG: hypothetical protein IKC31_02580 [Clostridia bacterium]|nr:hypothetical protein [Clostridia bacterium]
MEKCRTVGIERISVLFDAGTFVETGAYIKRADGTLTGVVSGYGAIDGRLVYAFAQDSDRKKGAFDAPQAKKIAALYAMAIKNQAPVIAIFDSIGATVCDGASVLSAYGTLLKAVSDASGVIPQIAIIGGVCAGMAATVAAMFDFVITIKDQSEWFVNAPFVLGKETDSTATYENGLASILAESEADAYRKATALVSLLPSNASEGVEIGDISDDVNRGTKVGLRGRALVEELSDANAFLSVGDGFGKELITGFARLGGVACGIIASEPACNGGAISADGAKKAARFIRLCDAYSVPIVTLVDSLGIEGESDAALASELAKLAMSYASATTARVTAVVGRAYGAAFTLLGSKALGADTVYATESAEISPMAPQAAVAFLWNDRITQEVSREDLEKEWKSTYASPAAAACDGSIDDVICQSELRQHILSAVYMLTCRDGESAKRRHCNLPL